MVLFGVVWIIICSRLPNGTPVRVYDDDGGGEDGQKNAKPLEEKASKRNQRRKLRRKLR
jgi:hypothetical protein